MKKLTVLFTAIIFTLFLSISAMAADLPLDEDVQQGKVSAEDVDDSDIVSDTEEKDEEGLSTEEADEHEASPSMPAEASKSVYFGDVRMYAGYTTLNMSDYNSAASASDIQQVNGGILMGVDLGYKISSYFSIGPRIQFIKGISDGASDKHKIEIGALPLMGGINGNFFIPDAAMRINGGIYAGYLFGFGEFEQYVGNLANAALKSTFSGGSFAADFELGINFHLNSAISFGVTGGYRIANISSMKAEGEFIPDSTIQTTDGEDLAFDLSGINVVASVSLNY